MDSTYLRISDYLVSNLTSEKKVLSKKFYSTFSKLYREYPNLITELIYVIAKTRGYNDLLYILSNSTNQKVNDSIYTFFALRLEKDLKYLSKGKTPSSLARYLPNEKTKWGKRINFVDNLMAKMKPHMNYNKARREYRKIRTLINENIGTIKNFVSADRFDELSFTKMSFRTLMNHFNEFIVHQECEKNLRYALMDRFNRFSLCDFINVLLNNQDPYITNMLDSLWPAFYKDFLVDFEYPDIFNHTLVIALTNPIRKEHLNFALGMALVFSEKDKSVMLYNGQSSYSFRNDDKPSDYIRNMNRIFTGKFNKINVDNINKFLLVRNETIVFIGNREFNELNDDEFNIKWKIVLQKDNRMDITRDDKYYEEIINPTWESVRIHRQAKKDLIIDTVRNSADMDVNHDLLNSAVLIMLFLIMICIASFYITLNNILFNL